MPRSAIEKTRNANMGRKHGIESIRKMSDAKIGKKLSAATKISVKFAHWNRNPDWKIAGTLFQTWRDNGCPTNAKMTEILGRDIKNIHRKFREGWNPVDDPAWIQYAVT